MVVFPPCKINLGLQVVARREDGYHELVTCFYPVPWCDVLEIIPSQKFSFTASGIIIPEGKKKNLCIEAYNLLQKDFNLPPVSIYLHKVIPIGAGLGGGSSDAASALVLLNKIFDLKLSHEALARYAAQLGSDCTFFTQPNPMLGRGRGEILEPITVDLKGKFLIIVKPEIHVSTIEAYTGVQPVQPETDLRQALERQPPQNWLNIVKNDFEESVFNRYPAIGSIKKSLYDAGALYASMSGSGSAVFGIFSSECSLKDRYSGMSYWSGWLP